MSDNSSSSKIQVDLINLDHITKTTLSFFFNSNLSHTAELNESIANVDLLILDYERGIEKQLINDLSNNNQYAIVLHMASSSPEKNDRVLFLAKPIKAKLLKQHIDSVFDFLNKTYVNKQSNIVKQKINKPSLTKKEKENSSANSHLYLAVNEESQGEKKDRYKSHKYVGSNKDILPSDINNINHIFLTPNKYLYYHLAKAAKISKTNKSNVIIKTTFGNIEIVHKTNTFHHCINEKHLKYMQTTPLFKDTHIQMVNSKNRIKNIDDKSISNREFIWESAILASKGRIPFGTVLENSVEMLCWPNLSKLKIFRYAVQISATWSRNKLSLIDTAKQLDIPQRYAFTLYCAMHAIECANINSLASNNKIENAKEKSVFSKILSHIFNKH